MVFTVCIAVFSGLVAVEPVKSTCISTDSQDLVVSNIAHCSEVNRDPLTICETRRVGAAKWFITVRYLETSTFPAKPSFKAVV